MLSQNLNRHFLEVRDRYVLKRIPQIKKRLDLVAWFAVEKGMLQRLNMYTLNGAYLIMADASPSLLAIYT